MRYVLVQMILDENPELNITRERYEEIIKARQNLTDIIAIEEKYDLLLENQLELECELAKIAARDMLFGERSHEGFQNIGNLLNRRVINVLTSCRSYLDHTDHHICNIAGANSETRNSYNDFRKYVYDKYAEFRIVEALRNYVQHRGFPIHKWSLGSSRVENNGVTLFEFNIGVEILSEMFKADGKFKAVALNDIDAMGGVVDLIYVLIKYIELIWKIHSHVRNTIKDIDSLTALSLKSAIDQYNLILNPGDRAAGLAAAVVNEDNSVAESTHIVPEALSFLQSFYAKNSSLANFGRRHVTTSIDKTTFRYITPTKPNPL